MRRFKSGNRNQLLILPPSLEEWLPRRHPARFVVDITDQLNVDEFLSYYDRGGVGGQPPFDPKIMIGVLLYGHMRGITSSRQIEKCLADDVGFRFIAANQAPDHNTVASFRKIHAERLKSVFVQVVRIAMDAGLIGFTHMAVDGTKIKSNASRARRKTKEELLSEVRQYTHNVEKWLEECDNDDEREDAEFGKDTNGYLLPEHLTDEEARQNWIRKALANLEAGDTTEGESSPANAVEREKTDKPRGSGIKRIERKKKKIAKALKALDKQAAEEKQRDPKGKLRSKRERKRGKEQPRTVNSTDADSRLMLFPKGIFGEGYNCQIAVDSEDGIIVAADVTQDGGDQRQLLPTMLQVEANTGWLPDYATADNGYFNMQQIEDPRVKSVEFFVSPNKSSHEKDPNSKSAWMRERLETEIGRAMYAARKSLVEPVFGMIKHARKFRQFLTRGKQCVTGEWILWCTAHNIIKLFSRQQRALAGA